MQLEGRTAIVTGANSGIGRVTALELGKLGARLVLAGRSEERTRPVVDAIRAAGGQAEFVPLDLGDLASVRACAEAFLARDVPLALLVNNAGLAGARGKTKDGFEIAFGTNHLGPYLLTRLLLPALERAGDARVVHVASVGHYRASGIDWGAVRETTATVSGFPETASRSSATCSSPRSSRAGSRRCARTRCTPARSLRTCGARYRGA